MHGIKCFKCTCYINFRKRNKDHHLIYVLVSCLIILKLFNLEICDYSFPLLLLYAFLQKAFFPPKKSFTIAFFCLKMRNFAAPKWCVCYYINDVFLSENVLNSNQNVLQLKKCRWVWYGWYIYNTKINISLNYMVKYFNLSSGFLIWHLIYILPCNSSILYNLYKEFLE